MATGIYSGVSGLALGVGLNKGVTGLWSGASGLITGWGGFSPAALFASSEPGAWYDPSDLSTLFQDSAGTTPVTATGQTVGLMLDKSKGLVLGPELVTNGDFSNGTTGWTAATATISLSGGTLRAVGGGVGSGFFGNQFPIISGNSYLFSFLVKGDAAYSTIQIGLRRASALGSFVSTVFSPSITTGFTTISFVIQASSTVSDAVFFVRFGGTEAINIDNISVRELPGNHATQSVLANRPIYGIEPFGGRRNLLTYSEQFDNAVWAKAGVTVTPNAALAPDNTVSADAIIPNLGSTTSSASQTISASAVTGSVFAKAAGFKALELDFAVAGARVEFDLQNGVVASAPANWTCSISSVGNGWYRCVAKPDIAVTRMRVYVKETGDGTSGIFIWGAQLETGSTATAYQRVTDQWNVTQAGVPSVSYLQYDGSDDWFVTPTITPGTDKAQVFAGVRKLSDAVVGIPVEFSVNAATNLGAFLIAAPVNAATSNYAFYSRGTATGIATANGFAAPITNILTGIGDIAADTAILRVNGAQAASSATDQGTGNYLAYPLYIGRRGGASLPFNGRIYSLIVRFGANLTADQIAQTEAWVNSRTGAY